MNPGYWRSLDLYTRVISMYLCHYQWPDSTDDESCLSDAWQARSWAEFAAASVIQSWRSTNRRGCDDVRDCVQALGWRKITSPRCWRLDDWRLSGALSVSLHTSDVGDSPLSQIGNGRYWHVMYKLLCPSIRVRTASPVSVMVRVRVSVSFSLRILFCMCGPLR